MKFLAALAMSSLAFLLFLVLPTNAAHWQPPVGIPVPAFGIEEVAPTYDQTNSLHYWVDNSVACSDSNNGGRGSPTAPRCSIPTTLSAGSLVEIRGGPYTYTLNTVWTLSGAASQPVFIRGPNANAKPKIHNAATNSRSLTIQGSYFIIEYLEFSFFRMQIGGGETLGSASGFISFRHNWFHDRIGNGPIIYNLANNFVLWDNEIERSGTPGVNIDANGFTTGSGTQNVWVVDNHIHDNNGDGILFCANCITGPTNVYIGRNEINNNYENAIDLKVTGNVIISENLMYGYLPGLQSGGEAIRINDEGTQGEIWIIYNTIHDASLCINGWHAQSNNYAIGNVLYNCGQGIIYVDNIISNTIYNTTANAITGNVASQVATYGATDATNNLISGAGTHFNVDVLTCRNNLVWQGGSATTVRSSCTNTITGDPLLNNPTANDFHLQSGSAAIDSGFNHTAYDYFFNTYGLNIKVDFDKNVRPQGSAWDIGAYEYFVAGPDTTPPSRSNGQPTGNLPAGTTSTTLSLTTNEAATCRYSTTAGTAYASMSGTFAASGGTSHSRNLIGLTNGQTYNYYVRCQDTAGNANTNDYLITFSVATPDTTPPTAPSGLTATVSGTSVSLSWTAATDNVGVTNYNVHRSTTSGFTPSTVNRIAQPTATSYTDSGLAVGTYYYRVTAQDVAGNIGAASNQASATVAADVTPPIISSVLASSITANSATITWSTNEASDTQVDYGLTAAYGSSTTLNTALVTSHSQTITGLTANTLYHYSVKSRDAAGNLATSADFTFTTLSTPVSGSYEGYGINTTGGTGGDTCRVTTLADSGTGSLRDCVTNRTGPRTVVFDVAGTITLGSDLVVRIPYLTIDGSTAPSPGITITQSAGVNNFIIGGTHDIILRHLRFVGRYPNEPGGVSNTGPIAIDGDTGPDFVLRNLIVDHISVRNSTDSGPDIWGEVRDVTISNSFFYQNFHPTTISHYPAPYQVRQRISMHHNVYANNDERNPQIRADVRNLDHVNNVIYNWGFYSNGLGYGVRVRNEAGEPRVNANIINNYFLPGNGRAAWALVYGSSPGADSQDNGPAGLPLPQGTLVTTTSLGQLYVSGNILPSANLDHYSTTGSPLSVPAYAQVTTYPASDLRTQVLPTVGMLYRDSTEQTLLNVISTAMGGGPTPDTTPPTLSNGQPTGALPAGTTSATLSLTTNEAATCRYSTTAGTAYASMTGTFTTSGSTSHSTTVSGLNNGNTYNYYVRCQDTAGNANTNDYLITFSVVAPDTTPPTAPSGLTATVSGTSISLSWTAATDNVGVTNYNVHRSTTSGFTPSTINRIAQPTATSYTDLGLAVGTYYYRVTAQDAAGNIGAASSEASATVTAVDTTAPVRSNGQPTGALPAGTTSATLSLTTNEAATCRYSTAPIAYPAMTNTFSTTGGTSHSTTVSGLNNGNTYNYYVRCQDTAGNANTNDYLITFSVSSGTDTTPPTVSITSHANGATVSGAVTISATASDNVGVAGVQFLLDGSNLGAEVTAAPYSVLWNTAASTNGAHTLTARARDSAGNTNTATVTLISLNHFAITFSVSSGTDTTPPLLSNGQPIGILPPGTSQATISLTTNEAATCRYSTSPNTAYASMTSTFTSTGGLIHSALTTGLTNGGIYNYYIRCVDTNNNTNTNDFIITFGVASQNKSVYNLTFIPRLEGTNYLTGRNFTFIMYYPGTTTQVAQFMAQPGATTGYIPLPPTVVMNTSTYDMLLDAPFYLTKKITNVSLVPNATITLPPLIGGDLNDDNVINSLDWSLMSPTWFTNDTVADINRDSLVNTIDFSLMNKNWGLAGDI